MATIGHGVSITTAQQTHATSTWTTKVTISDASLKINNAVFLLLFTARIGCSSATERADVRIAHGGTPTVIESSYASVYPSDVSNGDKRNTHWAGIFTQPATAEDVLIQLNSPDNSSTVRLDGIVLQWIRLDVDLTKDTDWFENENTTLTVHTTSFVDFASITFTPLAVNDWLIIASVTVIVDSTVDSYEYRINRDSDTETDPTMLKEGEHTDERRTFILSRVFTGLSTASHTFKVQGRDDSTGINDHESSRIIAIDLSKFKEHGSFYNTGDASFSTTPTFTEVANVDITPTVAADFLILYTGMYNVDDAGRQAKLRIQSSGTNSPIDSEDDWIAQQRDLTNVFPLCNLTQLNLAASAQNIDVDMTGNGSGAHVARDRSLIVLSMELAAAAALSLVYNQSQRHQHVLNR